MSEFSREYAEQEDKVQENKRRVEVGELQTIEFSVAPKLLQVVQSRKVWAGVIGLVTTGLLWGLGEIDGTRAVEALSWVLGIFIGSVALEDGMTRFFGTLVHAVASHERAEATTDQPGEKQKEERGC